MADAPDGDGDGAAGARADPEPSALARASMPVYVGGYLALYGMGDEGELVLTRERVARALPPAAPLPINIDHASACEVGAVLALADDDAGLFFVGVVNCPQLADVLADVAHPAFFGADAPALAPRERFLYLVSNYLPSVSLSSRRLAPGEEADGTLFAHVALCVLGRRVGTIVTYDATPEACVAPFRRLSPRARAALLADAEAARAALGDRAWPVPREALARTLLSTAVNNMLVRDKWDTVSRRRREAGIAGHTYLQASAVFPLAGGEEPERGRAQKGALAGGVCIALPVASGRARQPELPPAPPPAMSAAHQAGASPAHPLPAGDYVYVPTAQYNQLVVSQARGAAAAAPLPAPYFLPPAVAAAPPPPMPGWYGAAAGGAAAAPWHPGYGFPPPGLESQIMALAGAIADGRRLQAQGADGPGYDGPLDRRPPAKRRRYNWEPPRGRGGGDDDEAYYPGEGAPAELPPQHHRPPSPPQPAPHALSRLASAVSSLQQEVSQLRAGYPYGPAFAAAQHHLPPAPVLCLPQQQPQQYAAAPPQPVVAGPAPAPAQVLAPAPAQAPALVPAPAPPAAPAPAGSGGPPEEPGAAATVDASAVAGLPLAQQPQACDPADIFVAQMMRHR
ncbi:capsid maturation protease [Bubaline alphaherpesvirus 1]|uniref:Capsid scaffolding protein n=2 Tax=Bubaline alphaherpesvirus 1 TaxID=202910 RepID=A0A1L5JKH2_9ALPH|nr:capsid maturation protease [Bubaline alphaherpesvirus 1]APO15890.1 capsid maturation protease [Bubaline alphaherpesvirus 1]WPD94491.1 UL26 [Bubaline alphaherpesvirus 1]